MMWDGNDGSWGMYGGGGLVLILFLTLVASGVAALLVATTRHDTSRGPSPTRPEEADAEADRILQRRFAAGEIDEDEFLRRTATLHARL